MSPAKGAARKPPADRFDGMIGPGQLLAWVAGSCPFLDLTPAEPAAATGSLATLAEGPDGWLRILRAGAALAGARPDPASRLDYLALCLAAHHATVASYLPTDVDSKIRGELWRRASGAALRARWTLAQAAHGWSAAGVSTRVEDTAEGPLSGHQGEWLGVAGGVLGAALQAGDAAVADEAAAWMDGELAREARLFTAAARAATARAAPDAAALTALRQAWILTHNVGDVDQGLSYWPAAGTAPAAAEPLLAAARTRFATLAHSDPARHGGVFHRAKALYQLVAAEGHRNYPLREPRVLRRDPALLLPLGPCLEAWGMRVATSPLLNVSERAEVLAALLAGIAAVKGQIGYHRALVGLASGPGGLAALAKRLPAGATRMLDDVQVRKQLTVSEKTFAAGLAKRVREVLAG